MKNLMTIFCLVFLFVLSAAATPQQPKLPKHFCKITKVVRANKRIYTQTLFNGQVLRPNATEQNMMIYFDGKVDQNFYAEEVSNIEKAGRLYGAIKVQIKLLTGRKTLEVVRVTRSMLVSGQLQDAQNVRIAQGGLNEVVSITEPKTQTTISCDSR